MRRGYCLLFALLSPLTANALDVFACEPEWAALAHEIAGDRADVTVATTAFQDPHRLQAKPSLIAAVRNAELIICTGADLEIGWLPLLLRRAGNPRIQPGSPGYLLAADHVRKLEVPQFVDRSQGDIHPQGNPHVHLDPRNLRRVAAVLSERLVQIDTANAAYYRARRGDFEARLVEAIEEWEKRADALRGLRLAANHRSFSYLAAWLDLDIVAHLEPKPGIPPSGAHLARLLEQLAPNAPAAVIRTPYENEKPSAWLSKRLDIADLTLPYTVGGDDGIDTLFDLFEETIAALLDVAV